MSLARIRSLTVIGAVALATLLSGCGGATPAANPASSASSAATSESPTPKASPVASTPSPDPEPSAEPKPSSEPKLPTECATLGTEAVRAEAIGDLTLQSDGVGFVRPAPDGATLELGCDWIVGDSTGILLLISTAQPDAVAITAQALLTQGYTCQLSEDFGAEFCSIAGQGPNTEELVVARENVWIYMQTSNRNGRALLSDIVAAIFS